MVLGSCYWDTKYSEWWIVHWMLGGEENEIQHVRA